MAATMGGMPMGWESSRDTGIQNLKCITVATNNNARCLQ